MHKSLQSYSLTQRLSLLICLATSGIWIISLSFIYLEINKTSNSIFDQSLAETAHSLLSISSNVIDNKNPGRTILENVNSQHYDHVVFQLWSHDGQLIYRSVGVNTKPLINLTGFSWITIDGKTFRAYSVWNKTKTVQVQIAQLWEIRKEIQKTLIIFLFILTFIFLPLLCWLIIQIVKKNMSIISEISGQIEKKSVGNLSPIQQVVPQEIKPIIISLNTLLIEITESMEREKRFTSNAAHELRTPLSAIRVHAQVLQNARTQEEADNAIQDIITGVDKASRMISQLLTLARITPKVQQDYKKIDLSDVIKDVLVMLDFKIQQANIAIDCKLEPAFIYGQPEQIEIMLRNIIDNSIVYRNKETPAFIKITSGYDNDKSMIWIEDNGIGIPENKIGLIFQSFYRVNQSSAVIGSGLGLSIVKQIIELHHGKIDVYPSGLAQGVTFRIQFQAYHDGLES